MKAKNTNRGQSNAPPSRRRRAEGTLRKQALDPSTISAESMRKAFHELEVHQIELQTQNDELRHTQAELAHSRDELSNLYDFAPVGYLTLADDATVVRANLTLCAMLGVERRNLVDRKFTRFVAPEAQDALYLHQRAVSAGDKQTCELVLRRPDGRSFVAQMETIRVEEAGAGSPGLRSAITDISARRQAEDALRASENQIRQLNATLAQRVRDRTAQLEAQQSRLQAIADTAAEAIITIDEDGTVESINTAALQMFGYAEEEVSGRNVSMLMSSPDREAHDGYIRRYLESGQARIIGVGRTVTGRHKRGALIPLEIRVKEVLLSGVRMFVGLLRDVSLQRRLESQLRERLEDAAQLHRLRTAGELAGVLAHHINQPLAAILSFAEAAQARLRRGDLDPDRMATALAEIIEQTHRASQVIRDLRRFLSRERGEMAAGDINATVRQAYELMVVLANGAGIALLLDLSEALPAVMMLPSQIEQVLLIVLDNAIDAILLEPSGEEVHGRLRGTISVRTAIADEGGAIVVTVRDSGRGLDEKTAAMAFDPLYTTKMHGIGLGLSIAHSVIETHGGRIWAEAGQGGVFHFTLPIAK